MKAYWLDKGEQATIEASYLIEQGLQYMQLSTDPAEYAAPLELIKASNGYVAQDVVELKPDTPNLDGICANFSPEHTHSGDEVRFVLEGEGIFDVRDADDAWMRIFVEQGDLIVVPKDHNHRFFLTDSKHIRCVRLFKDPAGWVANYREGAAADGPAS